MKGVMKTPGVYIEETSAFSTSIVAVPTAVPAFVGYTDMAMRGIKPLKGIPTKIESFKEYEDLFGGSPHTLVALENDPEETNSYITQIDPETRFFMHASMKLFYSNGGGPCYIVSVGGYKDGENSKAKDLRELVEGIEALLKYPEPTMVVIPDAVLLDDGQKCYDVQKAMLKHCGEEMKSRVAILDIYDGYREFDDDKQPVDAISKFREGISNRSLDFGAAYYPWVNTTIVSDKEISSANISNKDKLVDLLKAGFPTEGDDIEPAEAAKNQKIQEQIDLLGTADRANLSDDEKENIRAAELAVKAQSPLYKDILNDIKAEISLIPPSGGIAGLISYVDNSMGVARSPANVGLNGVISPSIAISNKQQEDLNLPLDGKAVNAIRSFPGKGVLVWGARTLLGNSQDWRYLSVRRAIIMMEQSIKIAMGAFVFEPNNQNTWLDVKGSITNFLTDQWTNGVLVGASPAEAFSVEVGLGTTMTPVNVLDGFMIVEIKLAVVRPAEFIILRFEQKMQTS